MTDSLAHQDRPSAHEQGALLRRFSPRAHGREFVDPMVRGTGFADMDMTPDERGRIQRLWDSLMGFRREAALVERATTWVPIADRLHARLDRWAERAQPVHQGLAERQREGLVGRAGENEQRLVGGDMPRDRCPIREAHGSALARPSRATGRPPHRPARSASTE